MRIVEIIPQLHMGGAEHFTVDLCNELTNQGHEVILIVTNPVKKFGYFAQFLDSNVKLISMDKKYGADVKLFFRLPRLIKSLDPDIVHTHLGAIVYNIITPFIYTKARYYHTIHNAADKEATTGGSISAWIRKFLFNYHKTIPVTISEASRDSYYKYYGNRQNPELIINGVPYIDTDPKEAHEIDKSKISLVNVARVMPQKNQMALVSAVEELNEEGYEVELYLIGYNETPEGDAIRELNPKHARLLGPKDNPRDYMAAADAFILSSIYEGMPLTLIESMAVGVPSICTPVGGIVNMIKNGVNGILTANTDSTGIKDAIKKFIDMPYSKRKELGNAALDSYKNYSMEKCAQNYILLFSKEKL